MDEYQDSNEVQETLIRCVSRERFGTPNVFMVGDVKQSIYKFRLAKPELFLEKYESYGKEDGLYQKIELHKNFRSRPEVLSSINDVFYRIMTKQLGNIKYTDDAALYPGAEFPALPVDGQAKTEVLLLNTGDPLFDGMDEEKADYTAKEAEARLIAGEIKKLTDPEQGMKIFNGKTGEYEPLKKKDIVILLRSLSGWIFHGGGSGDRAQHAGTHRQSDAGYSVSWCVKVAHRRHEGPGAGHRDGGIQEGSGPRRRHWVLWGSKKIYGETRGIRGRCGYLSQVGSIPKCTSRSPV